MAQALARVKHGLVLHSEKHRRAFDSRYLEPFGDRFATALAEELLRTLEDGLSTGTAIQYHNAFRLALRWIAERADRCGELFTAVAADYTRVPPRLWQKAMDDWASHYTDGASRGARSNATTISTVNRMWRQLAAVLPKIEPLVTPVGYDRSGQPKRMLAEVAIVTVDEMAVERTLALLPGTERGNRQTEAGVRALVAERGGALQSANDVAGGLRELPAARLAGLRAQAETYLITAYERFRAGQKMLGAREDRAQAICTAIREEWERSLRAPIVPGQTGRGRPRVSARYLNDCTADEAFGNFLVFVDRELGGFLPARTTHTEYRRFYHRFVLRDFGGQASVEAYLAADSLTLVAALVIILTDCTWNLATGLGLRVGCIRKSTRLGHFEIHSFKAELTSLRSPPCRTRRSSPRG